MPRLSLLAAAVILVAGCSREQTYVCAGCNVVLVSIDTLRADHVGAYGYPRPTTPNLDALASSGVVFDNAVSQSSWTRPAHMSIMTGRYPNEIGFVGLNDRGRLEESCPTLASTFKQNGYTTAAFTGGVNVGAGYGFDIGFDLFRSNGRTFRDNLEELRYWLDELATEPFFLFWHGYDAHTPYESDAIDRSALGISRKPPRLGPERICSRSKAAGRIARLVDEYDAAVHRADRYLGKLIAELERRGVLERTVIVVVSDHGEEFREHGACFHLNTLYREVLHVPFVVHAPGLSARRVKDLVPGSVSVAKTILDVVGASGSLPGSSLARALAGGGAPHEPVVSETNHRLNVNGGRGHLRSLTSENEKLIDWITLERREWFDLARDPNEHSPLQAASGWKRAREQLSTWLVGHPTKHTAGDSAPSDEQRARNAEMERELRSLGYVE